MLTLRCQYLPYMLTAVAVKVAYMDATSETMGDRLRRARKEAGLTPEELANKVGLTRIAIVQWENGTTKNLRPENLGIYIDDSRF